MGDRVDADAMSRVYLDSRLFPFARNAPQLQQYVADLFNSLHAPVYRYLLSIVCNREEAEELTQETFLSLHTYLRNGRDVRNCRAWLFRVGHNLAINFLKKRAVLTPAGRVSGDQACEQIHDPCLDPEEEMLTQEKYARVRAALAKLAPQERRCLDLRAENLRFREIADVLNISISSVESYITRAIKKIMSEVHD